MADPIEPAIAALRQWVPATLGFRARAYVTSVRVDQGFATGILESRNIGSGDDRRVATFKYIRAFGARVISALVKRPLCERRSDECRD
jgi:hypothetical protein